MKKFMKLRQSLVPYIYTHSRLTYENSLGLLLPLYYRYPEHDEAYTFKYEYFFGQDLIVAPISQPRDNSTNMVEWSYWIPSGDWINIFTLDLYSGPLIVNKRFTLNEMPVFARAGSVIPMLPSDVPSLGQAQLIPDRVKWLAMIGGQVSGSGLLYDDDGNNQDYQSGQYSWTNASYLVTGQNLDAMTFMIHASQGTFDGMPTTRRYVINIKGVLPATSVSVNGKDAKYVPYNDLS